MKKHISFIILACMILSMLLTLTSCDAISRLIASFTPPIINGTKLSEFVIVYDEDGLDYNKRAAEYIRDRAKNLHGINLSIIDDDDAKNAHEIVVGETSRQMSASLDAQAEGVKFSILAQNGSVALEAEYFRFLLISYSMRSLMYKPPFFLNFRFTFGGKSLYSSGSIPPSMN